MFIWLTVHWGFSSYSAGAKAGWQGRRATVHVAEASKSSKNKQAIHTTVGVALTPSPSPPLSQAENVYQVRA